MRLLHARNHFCKGRLKVAVIALAAVMALMAAPGPGAGYTIPAGTTESFSTGEAYTSDACVVNGTLNIISPAHFILRTDLTISGTGAVNNTGRLTLENSIEMGNASANSGTLTNTGTMYIFANTSLANFGTITSSGTITITGGTLVLAAAGTYSGSGSFVFNGASGTLTNNQAAALNIATLAVNAGRTGTLNGTGTTGLGTATVNGSLNWTGTVTTRLSGAGTITGNVVNSGTLAPGNSIGTLTIVGNYTTGAASVYEVEANAAGQSDRLNVTGTATLDGRVSVLAESGNYRRSTTYTILNATGGIAGTFTGGVTSNLAFLTPSLSYDLNNVYLLLTRNATNFADVAATANQRSVASALDRGVSTATGDMGTVIDALLGLSGPQVQSAYNQMGGAAHTALSGASLFAFNRYIGMMGSRMGGFIAGGPTLAYTGTPLYAARTDVLRDAGTAMRRADTPASWGFWAQGYGSTGDRRGGDITSRYDYDMAGVVMGFDRKLRDDLLVGAAFGYSHTKATMNELAESGTVEGYNGSLYGTWKSNPWYVSGIAAFGYNRYDTKREVAFGSIARRATGTYGGTAAGGYAETGYVLKTAPVDIIPIAALQGTYLSRDSFTERNASSISLNADSDQTSSLLSSLGVRMRKDYKVTTGTVSPELSLRWDHEFVNDDFAVNASFAGSPVSTFTVRGDRPDRDSLGVDAGVLWQTADNLYLHLSYNGSFSGDDTNHGGTAGVKYRW